MKPTTLSFPVAARKLESSRSARRLLALGVVAGLLASGCLRMGPKLTVKDHTQYANAIGESWKTEALSNIVRMRYADWPVFMKVDTAVTNYTLQHQVIVGGVLRSPLGGKDNAQAFYTGKVNEAPRTIMTPMGGPAFVQGMLAPTPISVVLSLLQSSGWSAERVLETMVFAVNGQRNLHVMYDDGWKLDIDPDFAAFVDTVAAAHLERAVSIRRSGKGAKASMLLCFRPDRMSQQALSRLAGLRSDFKLDSEADCYTVISANRTSDNSTIALQTRSVLSLLSTLGAYVDIPAEDLASGVAPDIGTLAASAPDFMRIRSGAEIPTNPYAAIRYRDHWFWIDHTDSDSKRTFAYLALLMNLNEAGKTGGSQLVLNVGQQVETVDDADAEDDDLTEDL